MALSDRNDDLTTRERMMRGWVRAIASLLIALVFLTVLAVASAQQEALSALERKNSDLSYSVARRTLSQAEQDLKEQARLQKANTDLRAQTRSLERQKQDREGELYAALQEVDSNARSIARSGKCETLASISAVPAVPDLALWKAVQGCAQDGNVTAKINDKIKALLDPKTDPTMTQRAIAQLDRDIKANGEDAKTIEADTERLRVSIANADLVRDSLQDLAILDENPGIRIFKLTSFPPRLMQIILSFTSGLFGALLLTLILVVYPNNDLEFVESDSFWSRILLGGLISVGVYVIVGGGVAMIGPADAVASGGTNFMFFCAVGILAGMFSERVARFLSKRADIFLESDDQDKKRDTKSEPSG